MKRGDRRFKKYDDILWYVEQPLAERRWLRIGRNGAFIIPRRFHLPKKRISVLQRRFREQKRIPNPFHKGFSYYLLESLIDLGTNKQHLVTDVIQRVQALMSNPATIQPWNGTSAWDRWIDNSRSSRTLSNDWRARFEMNVVVLQRLGGFTPYARKLVDVGQKVMRRKGAVIDLLRGNGGEKCIRLNTNSELPRNDFKVRGVGSRAALAEEQAAKRGRARNRPFGHA
jgi:hypothetical protein